MNHSDSLPSVFTFLAPGEPVESLKWRTTRINRARWFSKQLWSHWFNIFEAKGYVEANLWLNQIYERMKLGNTGLFIDADDEKIKDYAISKTRHIAMDTRDAARRLDSKTAVLTIKTLFERIGMAFPLQDRFREDEYDLQKVVAAVARIEDPRWLARQLRNKASRALEAICRELGMVQRNKAAYISEFSLRRYFYRQNSNRNLLGKL